MIKYLTLLAVLGALGALLRYWVSGVVQRWGGGSFPWGTLAVNASGCASFGLIWALAEERSLISGQTRFVLLTGFLGAFTTFSTFAFETGELLRDGEWLVAGFNVLVQNLLGLFCVAAGITVGRWF